MALYRSPNPFAPRSPFDICQDESTAWLASHRFAACGDAPGLGKTVTALRAAADVNASKGLVICPAGVRSNWRKHCFESGYLLGVDIISYEFAINHDKWSSLRPRYDFCVVDESHFCKEAGSQRSMAVYGPHGLASRAGYVWALSGTFAPNGRPIEYWPMLKALCPAFAKMSFGEYARRFCGAYFNGREMDCRGASNIDEFKKLLDTFIIAHTKQQAFPGRSAPIVSRIGLGLSVADLQTVSEAEDAMSRREAHLSPAAEDYSQMGDMATLRRLVGLAAVGEVAQFVSDKLEGVRNIVLFYQHTEVGERLRSRLARFNPVLLRGGMTDAQKDEVIKIFGRDDHRLMLLQQQAGGTGINGLQNVCSTAVFAEPDWTPGETEQRIDRLDRMGAEGDLVTAYILYVNNTMSAAVLGTHDRKDKTRQKIEGRNPQ